MNPASTLELAELAMGSPKRIFEDWVFQKRMGWAVGWSPDLAIRRAKMTPEVRALIWC